ncbi:hypothetical protein GLYMA_15G006800v4 [Glycine max]|uniref:Uncharacterized protein n=3 Tax=Glycine subgen. Soja TaxID=1462606 RepID=K7M8S8_SOYBN|nr:hypothetical protein JHK87_040970 [Glycine soja]KAH1144856.1 hypothetical protein GYH30_040941 [Glycine max]KAH1207330.1 hypothetical protein GmHk_15G042465 [Glycine max]KHN22432.1 hypothetical protein glysoja_024941 [Glycine soja]KRH09714.1 hypothetical protein GLYMA_15G006800v4 [Glycine max]
MMMFGFVVRKKNQKKEMAISSSSEIGWSWRVLCQRVNPAIPNTPLFLQIPKSTRFTGSSSVVARAWDPKTASSQEEDLVYVGKLVAGSFAGGAAIKYGSALFPEITTPNLVLALLLILTPVLVAVFLLIKESRTNP